MRGRRSAVGKRVALCHCMGVSKNGGTPKAGWFMRENPLRMIGGYPYDLGNHHICLYMPLYASITWEFFIVFNFYPLSWVPGGSKMKLAWWVLWLTVTVDVCKSILPWNFVFYRWFSGSIGDELRISRVGFYRTFPRRAMKYLQGCSCNILGNMLQPQ